MQTTEDNTVEGTLKTEAVCQVNGINANGTCKTSPITAADVVRVMTDGVAIGPNSQKNIDALKKADVVLIFGTSRIPELGRGLGEGIRNFKAALKSEEEKVEEKKQA